MGTVIIAAVVFGAMALAARSIYRQRKESKANGGCGGSCSGCSGSCNHSHPY